MINIYEILSKFSYAESCQEIHRVSIECCDAMEIDYFFYTISLPRCINRFKTYSLSNFFDATGKCSADMAFFKNRVFEISINSLTPLIWSSCRHLRTPLKNINEFPNFEKRMLSDGMTTTIHSNNGGVATFSLAVKEGTIFDRDHKLISCYLHLISSYVYERVSKIYSEFVDTTALTKREIECLQWITQGKTAWEISKIVKISERTVEFHVKNTLDKLNCSNRAQAIAKAMMLGVLANASSIFDENMQFVGTPFHRDIRYV